jgi:ubiquinone/menaquinone biosynthesis C-methylase UbiE
MYSQWLKEILRCPETGSPLQSEGNNYYSESRKYPFKDGIISLVYPPQPDGSDARFNRIYDLVAPFYDLSEKIGGRLIFGMDMEKGREEIISLSGLKQGMRLLEVSPGPGVFQRYLRNKIGNDPEFVALDLSLNMLHQCRKRNKDLNVHLVHGNAQYLPFADNSFDALFHFGGINLFNEPQRAISEFIRVVKKDGIVCWGDEGISENYTDKRRKKIALRMNPGFALPHPEIPETVSVLNEYEVYGGLGYLVVAKKN